MENNICSICIIYTYVVTMAPGHHPKIRQLFPQAQMQTVPNTGHWIHASRPQDFIAAIQGFWV